MQNSFNVEMLFCAYGQKHPQTNKKILSACLTMWKDCHPP